MPNTVMYYLKNEYIKKGKVPPACCFLNSLSGDLMFFYTHITINGTLDMVDKELLETYVIAKKRKNALNRFAYICKIKRAKHSATTDLFFNSLDIIKPYQRIELYSNNTIYYFRLSDIINMLVSCLTKCENMFCTPIKMKNPYTNIEFTSTNLHNIYQTLLCSQFQIPVWITLFFEAEFNIDVFSYKNYTLLKELAIDDFMINGSVYEKFENIINMTHEYREYINYITIKTPITFTEKHRIVKKLSPFLKNYLFGEYSCHPLQKKRCKNQARRGLKRYFDENGDIQIYRPLPIGFDNRLNEIISRTGPSSRRPSIFNTPNSNINISLPPLPPPLPPNPPSPLPPIIETNIVSLNPTETVNETSNDSNQVTIARAPPVITPTREVPQSVGNHRSGSLFNLNLNRRNSVIDPFLPTFTLNRTPRRQGNTNVSTRTNASTRTNRTSNSFNMRMFNR
jgi:hypothetical protein